MPELSVTLCGFDPMLVHVTVLPNCAPIPAFANPLSDTVLTNDLATWMLTVARFELNTPSFTRNVNESGPW